MVYTYKGIEVAYDILGEGDTVVLLHGFLESMHMWQPLISEFKSTHTVVSIDLPGHGSTGCLGYIHTMEDMAEMVMDLMQYLNLPSAKFIGHSMGGYVALALNNARPDMVDGLCLMNSTFSADSPEKKLLRQRSIDMAKTNFDNLVRLSFSNLFAPASRISFKLEFENALSEALKTPVQGYIAAQAGMQLRSDHFESFMNIRGPKALVIGKKDAVVDGSFLKKAVEGTTVSVVELSGGHMSHIEDLYELSYFLLRFIEI